MGSPSYLGRVTNWKLRTTCNLQFCVSRFKGCFPRHTVHETCPMLLKRLRILRERILGKLESFHTWASVPSHISVKQLDIRKPMRKDYHTEPVISTIWKKGIFYIYSERFSNMFSEIMYILICFFELAIYCFNKVKPMFVCLIATNYFAHYIWLIIVFIL